MAGDREVNLKFNKQYEKFNYPLFTAIKKYNPSAPEYYSKDTTFNILVKNLRLFQAKIVAVHVFKMKDIPEEVIQYDLGVSREKFIKSYSKMYSMNELFTVSVLLRT